MSRQSYDRICVWEVDLEGFFPFMVLIQKLEILPIQDKTAWISLI